MSKKIHIKRISLVSLLVICILSCFGFVASVLSLTHILALITFVTSPGSVSFGSGFTPISYTLAMLGMLLIWPVIVGGILGCCGWLVIAIIGKFTSIELDIVVDPEESETTKA